MTTISVLYPRGKDTGGPEALHQLVDALNAVGHEAHLVPFPGTQQNPRVPRFAKYDAPERALVVDRADAIVVAPENRIDLLHSVRNARRVCWWLSVDNSSILKSERKLRYAPRGGIRNTLRRIKHLSMLPREALFRRKYLRSDIIDVAQSSYARSFLHVRFGRLAAMVSDYVDVASVPANERLFVAYNPMKGAHHIDSMKRLIELPVGVEWLALEGLTRSELAIALGKSLVYIDLGHQPGKDRLPREAALAGAVTIVGMVGAGAYWNDVPLSRSYRVDVSKGLEEACEALRRALQDPPRAFAEQASYRNFLRNEEERFRAEVEDFFTHGRSGDDSPRPIAAQ